MLHGIVALCPRAGSLLFARAYAPSFGLPLPSGGQPIDAHNLASLVFALQLNATAVLDGNSEDPTHGSANPALKSIDMGPGLRLVFYQDAKLPGLLLTLSLDPALGDRAQRRLAECICDAFAEAFGEQLRRHASGAGAPGPVRRLRGATELVQRCFASVSQFLLQDLMQTFSDTGSIMWGHAMQPETLELEALSIVRPREVSGEHVAGWNFEMGGLPSNVQELQILPAAHATGFDGVSAAGDAVGRGRGGDSPGVSSGGKRKAPEKLLSKCSQVPSSLFALGSVKLFMLELSNFCRICDRICRGLFLLNASAHRCQISNTSTIPTTRCIELGRFSAKRDGASGTRRQPMCTLRCRKFRRGALPTVSLWMRPTAQATAAGQASEVRLLLVLLNRYCAMYLACSRNPHQLVPARGGGG